MEDEVCRIEIGKQTLQMLTDSDAITFADFKLLIVDVKDFDYSDDLAWKAAKAKSDKAYKELKTIEYNIRHKTK